MLPVEAQDSCKSMTAVSRLCTLKVRHRLPQLSAVRQSNILNMHLVADGIAAFKALDPNKRIVASSVAICIVVRDQDIKEWVDHHRALGRRLL